MISTFLEKLPPYISVPVYFMSVMLIVVYQFIFTNIYGALALILLLYFNLYSIAQVSPLTPTELLLWIDGLSAQYKVAIFTSIITITGFIIAFYTATLSWKNQVRTQLKVQAADEIEKFFAIVLSNITTVIIHIESLVNTVKNIQSGLTDAEVRFAISYEQSKREEFISARDAISRCSIEVNRLISKNHNILLTGWWLLADAERAAKSLENITDVMWLHIPNVNLDDLNQADSFIEQLDLVECNNFLEVCETNQGVIAGLSGGIQGYLLSSIWGISSGLLMHLLKNWKSFSYFVDKIHEHLKNSSKKEI